MPSAALSPSSVSSEIYNDNVLDLLAEGKESLDLKEDPDKGVYVKDLKLVVVKTVAEINALATLGRKSRKVGSTLMNRDSSRSHCLFCIMIETSEVGVDGENHIRAGKLNMVDLAGSERQGKTGAEGDRLKEAAKINLALSALGNVIAALTTSKKVGHVPYRDSKVRWRRSTGIGWARERARESGHVTFVCHRLTRGFPPPRFLDYCCCCCCFFSFNS